ncbi:AAA family ATPase [Anaplasma capra]|uniref:AAA family ATPase n=1 Tax=Anaplasma capra TaxID=1562740 RepID=UPI0021D5AA03|nr:AAA family ATPase [Anaplasma capra]MCU7611442.1 AAA family ATPase [Anaplasma capra]MCU7612119.1 AAA family ATPase [Anaplasma capra]
MELVVGHTTQKDTLLRNSDTTVWLLCGKRGIGKCTLARAYAKHVTQSTELESNPDVMVIENTHEPINVDKVREMKHFLHMTAINSDRKVAIVDSIDDLNINSINAMLKTLEEPPEGSLTLLICHNLHSIPMVLRSRCATLLFHELSPEETKLVIDHNFSGTQHLSDKIASLYPGTPGMVTEDIDKEISLYENFVAIVHQKSLAPVKDILEVDLPLHKVEYILLRVISDIIYDILDRNPENRTCCDGTIIDMLERYHKAQEIFRTAHTMHLQENVTILRALEIIAGRSATIE